MKDNEQVKKEFSAYVLTAVKNTRGHYLAKKYKIQDHETTYEDSMETVDREDIFYRMESLSVQVLDGITEIRLLLDQIGDYHLAEAIMLLSEEQKKILFLRIFCEKSFREISAILGMPRKKVENTYYNSVKKIRKILGGTTYEEF